MLRKLALICAGLGAASGLALYLLTLPLVRRLPAPDHTAVDGVRTLDDAVAACRRANLSGWDLAAYAQHLVARKFTYSRLNTWDTPARAFARGMGYCEQQALALQHVYDRLGIQSRPVYAMRCQFPPKVVDGMPWGGGISGHAWLRVRIGGEERDVCPGSPENTPGVTQFQALSPVRTLHPWLRPWTHLGSSVENIRRDLAANRELARARRPMLAAAAIR